MKPHAICFVLALCVINSYQINVQINNESINDSEVEPTTLSAPPPEPKYDTTIIPPAPSTNTSTAPETTPAPTAAPTKPTTTSKPPIPTTPKPTVPPPITSSVTPDPPKPTPTPTIAPSPNVSTTAAPSPAPAPTPNPHGGKGRKFDGPSFIGGIILTCGLTAIGVVAFKFYKARTERNYHTLSNKIVYDTAELVEV